MRTVHGIELGRILTGYIECALWSTTDESDPETGGEPLDRNYGPEDIHSDTLRRMAEDCTRFEELAGDCVGAWVGSGNWTEAEQAGHDFWLTRNGHGAGFWDGDWEEETGERLTTLAKRFGEYNLYVGDDGMVHGCGGKNPAEVS